MTLAKTLCFAVCLIAALSTSAQNLANCSGNTLKSTGYVIEYSIGEVAIATLPGSNSAVTQGLLQPNVRVQQPDCDIINQQIAFFESPGDSKLRIVGIHDWIRAYQIFAADGRLIRHETFQNNYINIAGLPAAGIYFVRILPGCNGQFKILKFMKR